MIAKVKNKVVPLLVPGLCKIYWCNKTKLIAMWKSLWGVGVSPGYTLKNERGTAIWKCINRADAWRGRWYYLLSASNNQLTGNSMRLLIVWRALTLTSKGASAVRTPSRVHRAFISSVKKKHHRETHHKLRLSRILIIWLKALFIGTNNQTAMKKTIKNVFESLQLMNCLLYCGDQVINCMKVGWN